MVCGHVEFLKFIGIIASISCTKIGDVHCGGLSIEPIILYLPLQILWKSARIFSTTKLNKNGTHIGTMRATSGARPMIVHHIL